MAYKPELTHNARPATYTVDARDETGAIVPTPIAGEHPLTLYVDKKEIVTLMTMREAWFDTHLGFSVRQRYWTSTTEPSATSSQSGANIATLAAARSGR